MAMRIGKLGWVLLLLGLSGCAGMFGRQGLPADPLFSNGKPAEAKAQSGPPITTPFSEPPLPANTHVVEPR
jgi:hypothetical protein